ncbi:MAG: molybdopterin molybdotransferase MoeA [Sphingobium sp.]|jgi:molybdopterin molybdotransferase|nr:molybdopterin molybdotransferase MoeA [Sphingobium sp.]MCI1271936.1 molybdopterin molybdotransferase MoeA [Sphingobium sp.]MCI1754878.1 molybdopterin molybdotransferase MoeA [Sphingobium sp.]MCI2051622.1 molybdopterin molybdotransferase MoeA [Sphingobium sp.]
MSLLPVSDAQRRLLDLATMREAETVPVAQAVGRWITSDLAASRSQPATDLSAMDGYAVRHADMPGPWRVVGESAAGGGYASPVHPGEAVRIYTGAVMPEGADTVVIQENVVREGDSISLGAEGATRLGQNIRRAGSDFGAGQRLIAAGTQLTPRHIALAALGGWGTLALPRLPRIALLSTGSELVPPGMSHGPAQIPASNGAMLSAMLAGLPCAAEDFGIIPDTLDALTSALASTREHDIVVTTGGASVGDHDLVKPALEAAGGSIDFWKIRMRPGKPLIAGTLGKALFLGLPGNPVSAYVTATLFLLPLVRSMAGCPDPRPKMRRAVLGAAMPPVGGRDDYVRAVLVDGVATPVVSQDSAATRALAQADCLIVREAGSAAAERGAEVTVIAL